MLDEPTNHLDVEAIEWLETELKYSSKSFVIISHDRAFLSNLTNDTIWVDRGKARRCSVGFGGFEAWRDKVWRSFGWRLVDKKRRYGSSTFFHEAK